MRVATPRNEQGRRRFYLRRLKTAKNNQKNQECLEVNRDRPLVSSIRAAGVLIPESLSLAGRELNNEGNGGLVIGRLLFHRDARYKFVRS